MPSKCPASPSLERTWTATDASYNTATCVQTITFVDCGLSLFPDLLAFLESLDTTPLFGDMTGLLRTLNEQRKEELITHALAARALLESGDRAGALDQLAWIKERATLAGRRVHGFALRLQLAASRCHQR